MTIQIRATTWSRPYAGMTALNIESVTVRAGPGRYRTRNVEWWRELV